MRKNLGNFLLFILLSSNLFALEYRWSVTSSKKVAYVNEAIYLKYVCEFAHRAELYSVEFNPVTDNEVYEIEPLSEATKLIDGKRVHIYEYVAFVKKPMQMEFSFEALMKKTTQGSIETTVLGRDNAQVEQFTVQPVRPKSVLVDVKKTDTEIFASLSLDVKKDKPELQAYKPFHLEIRVSGVGNIERMQEIEFNIDDVKVFSQKPIKNLHLTKHGYQGSWSQKFAFVSAKDFTILGKKIEYFDSESKTIKELHIEAIDVKVDQVYEKSELLDEEKEYISYESLLANQKYFYYFLTFVAGFLLAKIRFKRKEKDTLHQEFIQKVQNAKSFDALSMVLILKDTHRFSHILKAIDSQELHSLGKAKSEILKLIAKEGM